jgi:serine/threonine protein phosphatase PrpC
MTKDSKLERPKGLPSGVTYFDLSETKNPSGKKIREAMPLHEKKKDSCGMIAKGIALAYCHNIGKGLYQFSQDRGVIGQSHSPRTHDEILKHLENRSARKIKEIERLHQEGKLDVSTCGSTSLEVEILPKEGDERRFYIANTGDSRAILTTVKKSEVTMELKNKLHNPDTNLEERKRVQKAGGKIDGCYVQNDNDEGLAVTRAIGDNHLKSAGVIPDPEITHVKFTPSTGERIFLLVGSDGFYSQNLKGAEKRVGEILTKSPNLAVAAYQLIELSREKSKAARKRGEPKTYCDDAILYVIELNVVGEAIFVGVYDGHCDRGEEVSEHLQNDAEKDLENSKGISPEASDQPIPIPVKTEPKDLDQSTPSTPAKTESKDLDQSTPTTPAKTELKNSGQPTPTPVKTELKDLGRSVKAKTHNFEITKKGHSLLYAQAAREGFIGQAERGSSKRLCEHLEYFNFQPDTSKGIMGLGTEGWDGYKFTLLAADQDKKLTKVLEYLAHKKHHFREILKYICRRIQVEKDSELRNILHVIKRNLYYCEQYETREEGLTEFNKYINKLLGETTKEPVLPSFPKLRDFLTQLQQKEMKIEYYLVTKEDMYVHLYKQAALEEFDSEKKLESHSPEKIHAHLAYFNIEVHPDVKKVISVVNGESGISPITGAYKVLMSSGRYEQLKQLVTLIKDQKYHFPGLLKLFSRKLQDPKASETEKMLCINLKYTLYECCGKKSSDEINCLQTFLSDVTQLKSAFRNRKLPDFLFLVEIETKATEIINTIKQKSSSPQA